MKLVYHPHPALFTKCNEVVSFDDTLHRTLDEMKSVMRQNSGMGLAANQVNIIKKFFIMQDQHGQIWEFINPTILEKDDLKANLSESCLSAPCNPTNSKVHVSDLIVPSRALNIVVQAQDRYGEEFTMAAYGIEAVCIQHEYDHLNGEFFFDKLASRNIKKNVQKQWKKLKKKKNF